MRIPKTAPVWTMTLAAAACAAVGLLAQQAPPAGAPKEPGAGAQQTPGGRRGGPPPPGAQMPGGFGRLTAIPFPDAPQEVEILGGKIRVVPVAKGLVHPWSLTFLPNGDMLVTEKPGRLRAVRNGALDPQPISGVPEVWATGQGGLLEVLPHPRFSENGFLYLTYSKPCEKGATTALYRGRFDGKALVDGRDLFVAQNCNTGNPHFGSKLAWGPDGMLYMTIGDRGDRKRAQDLGSHGGKLLRLREDGTAPPDNPFVGKDGAKPEIYSYGHRNAQGLAFHPETGVLWETEHGPQGGDELNIIKPGKNYGWPVATYGREYAPDGAIISERPSREDIEEPVLLWVPSIGASGLIIYTGDRFPGWKGQFFSGGLSGLQLHRHAFNEKGGLLGREAMLTSLRQRVRDVRQGPEGFIYLAIDSNAGGVFRLEPTAATPSTAAR